MRILFLDDEVYRVEKFIENTNHQVDVQFMDGKISKSHFTDRVKPFYKESAD